MIEKLVDAAGQFRRAVELTDPSKLPIGMQAFPAGACGDATLLLGFHLKSLGYGTFDYVLGGRGDGHHSHAWLKQGDILIDITADQFSEIGSPVIVAKESAWHETFEVETLHEADFHIYDDHTVAVMASAYRVINQTLEAL